MSFPIKTVISKWSVKIYFVKNNEILFWFKSKERLYLWLKNKITNSLIKQVKFTFHEFEVVPE